MGLCIGAWLATGVFLPQGLVAQDVAEEIKARHFVVVDERGNDRIEIGVLGDVQYLTMYDERGRTRNEMNVLEGHPMFIMLDERGNTRIYLNVLERGPWFVIFDESGNAIWQAP